MDAIELAARGVQVFLGGGHLIRREILATQLGLVHNRGSRSLGNFNNFYNCTSETFFGIGAAHMVGGVGAGCKRQQTNENIAMSLRNGDKTSK